MTHRSDETWHRLRDWTDGSAKAERLAAQILLSEGFVNFDPCHPRGGPDGTMDAKCLKDGVVWAMAAYFPTTQQRFAQIRKKFLDDIDGVHKNEANAFAFVTNQELKLSQRDDLKRSAGETRVELFHLERIATILDRPEMSSVRAQFLGIDSAGIDQLPSFSGEIGHHERALAFSDFIFSKEHRIVHLDVFMREDVFDGDSGDGQFERHWFVLRTHATAEPPATDSSVAFGGEGIAFNVDSVPDVPESSLECYRGICRLSGYFVVVGFGGPNQGLLSVRLRPIRSEQALKPH